MFLEWLLAWNIFHILSCFDDLKASSYSSYIKLHRHVLEISKQPTDRPENVVKPPLTAMLHGFWVTQKPRFRLSGTVFHVPDSTRSGASLFDFMISGKSWYFMLLTETFKQQKSTDLVGLKVSDIRCQTLFFIFWNFQKMKDSVHRFCKAYNFFIFKPFDETKGPRWRSDILVLPEIIRFNKQTS